MSDCDCVDGIVSADGFLDGSRIYFACPRCAGGGDRRAAAERAGKLTDLSFAAAYAAAFAVTVR